MFSDKNLLFSEEQNVTASAASTQQVDTLDGGNEYSNMWVCIIVKEDFASLTSLGVQLRQADTDAMGDAEVLLEQKIPVAQLKKGGLFAFRLPLFNKRFLDLNYAVEGSDATAGSVTAFIADAAQTAGL